MQTVETIVEGGEIVAKRVLGEEAFDKHYAELVKDYKLLKKGQKTYDQLKKLMK